MDQLLDEALLDVELVGLSIAWRDGLRLLNDPTALHRLRILNLISASLVPFPIQAGDVLEAGCHGTGRIRIIDHIKLEFEQILRLDLSFSFRWRHHEHLFEILVHQRRLMRALRLHLSILQRLWSVAAAVRNRLNNLSVAQRLIQILSALFSNDCRLLQGHLPRPRIQLIIHALCLCPRRKHSLRHDLARRAAVVAEGWLRFWIFQINPASLRFEL